MTNPHQNTPPAQLPEGTVYYARRRTPPARLTPNERRIYTTVLTAVSTRCIERGLEVVYDDTKIVGDARRDVDRVRDEYNELAQKIRSARFVIAYLDHSDASLGLTIAIARQEGVPVIAIYSPKGMTGVPAYLLTIPQVNYIPVDFTRSWSSQPLVRYLDVFLNQA